MTQLIVAFLIILLFVQASFSFEVDGFKSGMTREQAKNLIEKYNYDKVEFIYNSIVAMDTSGKRTGRRIVLSFCEGKLVRLRKGLQPRFDYFVRLLDEKRNELGRPIDAFARPSPVTSNFEMNSLSFFWKDGPIVIEVEYTDFGSSSQLDIGYEIGNQCWKSPY